MQECENCGKQNAVNEYEFYYGYTFCWNPGRSPFDKSGVYRPGRASDRLDGSKKRWICDSCIFRKRIFFLKRAIVFAIISFATSAVLYHYWIPLVSTVERFISSWCCLVVPLLLLGGFCLLVLPILFLSFLLQTFEKKEEIGASLAIEVQKKTPEEIKRMSDLKKSNEEVDAGNLASGLTMNPRTFVSFWTPREKSSKRFLNQ
jgi:hypothetical protein